MVIVFDLDDTLYPELTYVHSGYHAVAHYLAPILNQKASKIFEDLQAEEVKERNFVFDRYLEQQGQLSQTLVKQCLRVYRGHEPMLTLFAEAENCLNHLQHHSLYIVTDGHHLVQRRKFLALGLQPLVKQCFFTYAHGLSRRKPSPYCFEKICQLEQVDPSSVVYIADNPYKDFVGIKPLGFQTVRVLTGAYRYVRMSPEYEADRQIQTLQELDEIFLQSLELFKGKSKQ
jgi:putative hydrolase of the HAD superfamily